MPTSRSFQTITTLASRRSRWVFQICAGRALLSRVPYPHFRQQPHSCSLLGDIDGAAWRTWTDPSTALLWWYNIRTWKSSRQLPAYLEQRNREAMDGGPLGPWIVSPAPAVAQVGFTTVLASLLFSSLAVHFLPSYNHSPKSSFTDQKKRSARTRITTL